MRQKTSAPAGLQLRAMFGHRQITGGVSMGEFEAIGDAVTGGLLARAIEPVAGKSGADGLVHEQYCLNCGSSLSGPYCYACGQKAHVRRSIQGFLLDFVQGLYNFDGKFWRTLPMLAWHPGEMTRRYIAGQRVRFISPAALYLFTVFAMFAVLNFTGALNVNAENFKVEVGEGIAWGQRSLAKLEAKRKDPATPKEEWADLDRRIANRKEDIAESQRILTGQLMDAGEFDEDTPGWVRAVVERAQENPGLMAQKIQEAASKYSWLLIPISVPFLWLLFPLRRRHNLYDHTVFVTYSLSFMMMLVIASGLLIASGYSTFAAMLLCAPPFHMYRHLKGAYELGRFSALMRTIALVSFAFAAAAIFLVVTVAIGAM